MTEKLFLGQIIKVDNLQYTNNNLILSPTGSGKTYFIMNELVKVNPGRKLMLLSTTSLKESVGELEHTLTSQEVRRKGLGIADEDVHIMTYYEFGSRTIWNNDFLEMYDVIFCDEIHSLMDYYMIDKSAEYAAAIKVLFDYYEDKKIFHFTATTDKIDKFINMAYQDLYRNVNIIDYNGDERIKKYHNSYVKEVTSVHEIENAILGIEDMRRLGEKGIFFNERIDGMERIEMLLSKKGLRSISIWSTNNKKHEMTDEQLAVRSTLLKTGIIPEGYDFIIINGAMREGWNLKDERVEMAILNTLDETNKVQARGRIRKDISLLIERVEGEATPVEVQIIQREKLTGVIERVLGEELTSDDKNKIVEEMNIRNNENGRIVGWTTIKSTLDKNGYVIKDKRIKVDGKQIRVSIITKLEKKVKKSTSSKSAKFLSKLGSTKFAKENKVFLSKYINNDDRIAYAHIKSSYEAYVGGDDWSERKFTDVTYLLARDNKLFIKANYSELGLGYNELSDIEVLTERAKYEEGSLSSLEQAKKAEEDREQAMEQELLDYIRANS